MSRAIVARLEYDTKCGAKGFLGCHRVFADVTVLFSYGTTCSEFCGVKSQRECSTTFRVINSAEDAQLYLDVYRKYSRVSRKVPCVQQGKGLRGSSPFVGGVGDGLDKRKLQPSGHSDIFEAYLALCSSGAADSQNNYPVSQDGRNTRENYQLRSTIGVSNNGSSASLRGRNVQVHPRLNSAVGVQSTSRRIGRRVLTSGGTADTNSVASAGTSYMYSDLGDYDQRWHYCGASFWYVERLKGHSHNQTPEYHLCCADAHNELVQLFQTARDKCRELDIPEFKIWLYNAEGARGYELPTSNTLVGLHKKKQNDIRSDYLSGLYGAISRGERDGYKFEGRIILHMSFTGEIKRFMLEYPHLTASDRADVVCRVFEQKIHALIAFLKEERTFGDVIGASRIRIVKDVDRFISVELSNPRIDPEGYNVVSELMMHGPCGAVSLKAPCMKGTDRVFVRVSRPIGESFTATTPSRHVIDEIQNYVEGRFICAHVAYWRILKFDIHRREPAVQILAMHLEDMHRVTFRDQDRLKSLNDLPRKKSTTLTEWFAFNEANEVGRHLSYLEFPSEFVWYFDRKSWSSWKNSKSSIGRLAYSYALGLLGDDKEWEIAYEEACGSATTKELRFLFSHILLYCDGYTLYEIEIVLSNCGKSLYAFGLPPPPEDLLAQLANRLLMEERNYNREELAQLKDESVPLLNAKQRQIYDIIMNVDTNNQQELIFVYGDVESLGIASLLLPSGRTAHSRFKLPLELPKESLCRITNNTQLGKLLANTDLIIWDEAPMNNQCCFEAIDRSLRDIIDKPSSLFNEKSVLLGGDFRQTIPVKKGASKIKVISSCISESELWPSFKVFTLKYNMRLARSDISLEERSLRASIRERKADEDLENTSWVQIPPAYCLPPDNQVHQFIIMSNINNNMQTQTSNSLHNAIMKAGSKDRPPMLAPGNYIQWKSRIKRYIYTKPNRELIHYCLENPPYELGWKDKFIIDAEGNLTTATHQ
nr:DNA helicase [Tanacetum cinerariifolium]